LRSRTVPPERIKLEGFDRHDWKLGVHSGKDGEYDRTDHGVGMAYIVCKDEAAKKNHQSGNIFAPGMSLETLKAPRMASPAMVPIA
jgi:hypothetical protein